MCLAAVAFDQRCCVGLKSVSQREIVFVTPPAISSVTAGTQYPLVVNNNGTEITGNLTIVPARPDIFTNLSVPGPGGPQRFGRKR